MCLRLPCVNGMAAGTFGARMPPSVGGQLVLGREDRPVIDVTLGVDIGTGSSKAGLVDTDGRLLAVARVHHRITHPRPGWSESDPDHWLASAATAVAGVLDQAPDVAVQAIGLSGQMHGVVLVDRAGQPVRPAVLWSDRRAGPELHRVRTRLGATVDRLANPIVTGMAGPTLATLARAEPESMEAIEWTLQAKDWIRLQLTGQVATDPSDASATLLWDVDDDAWSLEACAALDVPSRWLPEVRPSHTTGGHTTVDAAELLGVEPGIPVAVGAADTAAAILGAGLELGQTQVSTGTGGQIARLLDQPIVDRSRRTHLFRAAEDDRWYAMAAIQNAGIAIDWALRVLDADLDRAQEALATTPTGAHGVVFVPYLTGERTPHMNADLTGQWAGLHPETSRNDLIRSVFEGVAYALRDGLEALRDAGHDVGQALLAGGGSVSPRWRQLLADALGIPMIPHDATDASVRGAALLAWRCLNHSINPAAAVHQQPPVEPQQDLTAPRTRFHRVVAAMTEPTSRQR